MHRFLLKEYKRDGHIFFLYNREQIHQIKNVLKLKKGEKTIVFNQKGTEITLRLEKISDQEIISQIIRVEKVNRELSLKINLYQALLKYDNFDWVLKEATSLGVAGFVPIITERTVIKEVGSNKLRRWQKIIEEAVEQSGRCEVPLINKPILFKKAIEKTGRHLRLMSELSSQNSLRQILPLERPREIDIFIGPEGGFTKNEIIEARNQSLKLFNFGSLVLRAEAFSIAIVAAIRYHYI